MFKIHRAVTIRCVKNILKCVSCVYMRANLHVLDKMSNIELYRLFLFVKYFYFKILNKHLGLGWFHTYRKRITKTPITTTLTLLYSKQCIHTAHLLSESYINRSLAKLHPILRFAFYSKSSFWHRALSSILNSIHSHILCFSQLHFLILFVLINIPLGDTHRMILVDYPSIRISQVFWLYNFKEYVRGKSET